ncbi:MAG: mechanosensitive ion channel family protein [[Clostridium] fimetarium]|nr:mechanosensitive ion channel family protein [[Clostridium] fimetarium]
MHAGILNLIPLVAAPMKSPIDVSHFIGDRDGVSYAIARFIMSIVDWILGVFNLDNNTTMVTFLYAAVVLGVALVAGYIVQWLVLRLVSMLAKRLNSGVYVALTSQNFFHKVCRIITPLVFLILIQFTLSSHNSLSGVLTKVTLVYIVFVIVVALSALVNALWHHIDERANKRHLPLNGLAQLAKGVLWILAAIIVVAIIVDKSPGSLLAGLGAFAAVLMLVFKDSILGVVAGVQLSENDSLHVGDWIAAGNANGTVQEVSLTAVKVLNWDKTTTTLPPYSLISNGFTNYRTMQVSHTRRICRSFMIDADSVLPATPEMLDALRSVPLMDAYIAKKLEQREAGQVADVDNPAGLVNGTIDTNLGLFRAYFKMWLDANPNISHDDDCFVTSLAQTSAGIPFQVYCFTATSAWFAYEAIQDSVFEHLAAMLRFFQLYTFENPSGRDTVIDGYLSPGGDIDDVFGVPYPFFQSPSAPDSPASTRVAPKREPRNSVYPAQSPAPAAPKPSASPGSTPKPSAPSGPTPNQPNPQTPPK